MQTTTNRASTTPPLPGQDRSGWMTFRHAGPLQLLALSAEQVDVRDIVHGLGQINRFNGQTAEAIPVLWHSLMVMRLCENEKPAVRLEALFHDAGETYMGDWIRPLRDVMGEQLLELRSAIQKTVFEAVGLDGASPELSEPVRRADKTMLHCEIDAPWGYGRTISWYGPPSEAEREHVLEAMKGIGKPPQTRFGITRIGNEFLKQAGRLVRRNAPIRASIDQAINDLRS